MATNTGTLTLAIRIKPELSWSDALKMRLAGAKYMEKFWEEALKRKTRNQSRRKNLDTYDSI
jgi:hypothetical protein